jgi:hypothetical protein
MSIIIYSCGPFTRNKTVLKICFVDKEREKRKREEWFPEKTPLL